MKANMLARVSAVVIGTVTRNIHSSGDTPAAPNRPASRNRIMRVGPSNTGAGCGPRSSSTISA
jgi:hypothetical protein